MTDWFSPTLVNQILHFTLFHNHSSSFVIFRNINSDHFSWTFTKVCVFDSHWQTNSSVFETIRERSSHLTKKIPWQMVKINIAIFCESSLIMVVIICQFPPSLTKRAYQGLGKDLPTFKNFSNTSIHYFPAMTSSVGWWQVNTEVKTPKDARLAPDGCSN